MTSLALMHLTAASRYWAAVALVAALIGIGLYYRRTLPPLRRSIKIPLVVLRTIAAVALFLALADALWAAIRSERHLYDLAVLVDRSASMEQTDDLSKSRFDRAEAYFDRIRKSFADRANVHRVYFADSILSASPLPDSFGLSTALGDGLTSLAEHSRDLNLRAAVVLSDGASNRGSDPREGAVRLGVPIATVGFGKAAGPEARVVEAATPEVALTGKPFDITGSLQGEQAIKPSRYA